MGLERFSAAWREAYVAGVLESEHGHDASTCVFCELAAMDVGESSGVLKKSASSFVVLNAFPYGSGHLLVVPRRHVAALEELSDQEYEDYFFLLRETTAALERAYHPEGMNVGINLGVAAGAGIPRHLHTHALPRWAGDTNFMTTIGETRVLPESLGATWRKVQPFL